MSKEAAYSGIAAVLAGGLLWGVMEIWHMLLGHGATITNVGSIALGAISVIGYYLFSEVDQLDIQFEEEIAALALIAVAVVHSAYWFVKPEFIGMGPTVAITAAVGTAILGLADY